jgi:hypothetical protein
MRSQVQVLAGPPAITAGQSAAGSKPGNARCEPGPRWGRTLIPAGKPIGPSGPVHAGRRRHDNHAEWSSTQPQDGNHAAGAATSSRAHRAAAGDGRSARRPGLPRRPASSPAAARTRPGPGPPSTAPPTMRDLGGVARVRVCSAVDPSRSTTRRPQGTWTRSRGAGCLAASACPQTPPPDGDQTDASGRTGRTPDGWTPDGPDTRRPDAGSRTTNPGDWTPDGAGHQTGRTAGQPGPDDGTGWACGTRTGDRRHGWRPGMVEHGDGA